MGTWLVSWKGSWEGCGCGGWWGSSDGMTYRQQVRRRLVSRPEQEMLGDWRSAGWSADTRRLGWRTPKGARSAGMSTALPVSLRLSIAACTTEVGWQIAWGWGSGPVVRQSCSLGHGSSGAMAMLARLDGDFAFVICDLNERTVIAASDPMGMRALFYCHRSGQGFAFSTCPEALARWVGLDPRIPESRLLEPLFGTEPLAHFEPEVRGISRMPAAHVGYACIEGMHTDRYWSPGAVRPSLAEGAIDGWIEALRWHVSDAVRKRLDDGVIAGLTFSGGLDSSAILTFSCSMAPERVTTYSAVDRGNPDCPETTAIDRVLATKRVRSVQVDVADMHAYGALALQLVAAAPRFVAGRNGFLAMFDHMAAGSGADVMMNGLDADCLFGYGGLIERQVTTGGYKQALHDARKLDRLSGGPWMVPEVRRARLTARLPWALRLQVRSLRSRLAESRRLHDALLRNDVVKRLQLRSRFRAMRQLTRQAVPLQRHVPASDLMNPYTLDGIGRFQHSNPSLRYRDALPLSGSRPYRLRCMDPAGTADAAWPSEVDFAQGNGPCATARCDLARRQVPSRLALRSGHAGTCAGADGSGFSWQWAGNGCVHRPRSLLGGGGALEIRADGSGVGAEDGAAAGVLATT